MSKIGSTAVLLVALLTMFWAGRADATGSQVSAKPMEKAKMVCAAEVKNEIAGVLAIKPSSVTSPKWSDQRYSCTYRYRDGSFTLSVKELPDRAATIGYFDAVGSTRGRQAGDLPMGDNAFQTPSGAMVVRKDDTVLVVDTTKLPDHFGKMKLSRAVVSTAVARTVLECWNG